MDARRSFAGIEEVDRIRKEKKNKKSRLVWHRNRESRRNFQLEQKPKKAQEKVLSQDAFYDKLAVYGWSRQTIKINVEKFSKKFTLWQTWDLFAVDGEPYFGRSDRITVT